MTKIKIRVELEVESDTLNDSTLLSEAALVIKELKDGPFFTEGNEDASLQFLTDNMTIDRIE